MKEQIIKGSSGFPVGKSRSFFLLQGSSCLRFQVFWGDVAPVPHSESRWLSSCARDCGSRRRFFNSLDLRVQPFARGIGNLMVAVGQHVRQVALQHPSYAHYRLQLRMRRPKIPLLPEPHCPSFAPILPQDPQTLLDGPGPTRFQLHRS